MKHATPVARTFRTLVITLLLSSAAAASALTVTNTADSGSGSLRDALFATNVQFATEIEFALPPGSTIVLTSGPLKITSKVIITGPGANLLTIQRSTAAGTPKFRVFHSVPHNGPVTISGLTIANGDASGLLEFGGGILNEGELTLSGVTVSGNTAFGGGGVWNESGSLTLIKSTVSGNSAGGGGGISGGTVNIMSSTISGNTARDGNGGGIAVSIATLVDSTVTGNSATSSGGGIFNNAGDGTNLKVRNCIIALNTAASGPDVSGAMTSENYNVVGNASGATIIGPNLVSYDQIGVSAGQLNLGPLQDNGGPTKTHALLAGSVAIDRGDTSSSSDQRGLVRTVDSPPLPNAAKGADVGAYEVQADSLPGCVSLVENLNDSGPGSLRAVIANACAGSTISFAPNVRGTISLTSGHLAIDKVLTIDGPGAHLLTVERNASAPDFRVINIAPFGGDIGVTINGLTIANGRFFDGFGGGIAAASKATINRCIISGNAADRGGGIFLEGPLTLTDSTVTGNSALNEGGGIYSKSGRLTINRSTLSANGTDQGGAIYSISDPGESEVTITDSTISGNSASDAGGGIFALGRQGFPAVVTITNSTIAGNSAADAAGGILHGTNSTLRLRNSIVALNTAGASPNIEGHATFYGFNLIGTFSGTFTRSESGDRFDVTSGELNLGPLQDNGGPTHTHALLSGSVAIDGGHSSGTSTDQRGAPRPLDRPEVANNPEGDGADVGAFEFQTATPTPTPTPTVTPAPSAKLGNIATRVRVETGENVLIGGFIITGSQPKRLIVRAIAPSLPNVSGALTNPQLEIYRGDELLAANDNWREAPNQQEMIDSTVAPSNDLESAILTTLDPGAYTAVVSGVGGETGVGSVEAYDLDLNGDSTFANISTRGRVLTDANVMIGGVIVTGSSALKVIVRAIGPSLGIAGQLEDPLLELFDGDGNLIASNDNWKDAQQSEIEATTIPPSNDLECAIVRNLPPAAYTAIVSGVGDTTGVALVEVYALK